jgi:twitching motility protein PilT
MNAGDIFRRLMEAGASDLHLVADMPPLGRLQGNIVPLFQEVLPAAECRNIVLGLLTESQRARFEETWELDFVLEIENVGRFRANAHFSKGNVEASFRVIPQWVASLNDLGHLPGTQALAEFGDGLVLVTGTTGSGKSTTLASLINGIASSRSGVIVTIEDPVEFLFQHQLAVIKQREVGSDTKGFSAALKHVLRQDPDVIVVSEMRDRETIQAGITAAETGHLVLATLHTMDAPKTIDRMVDIFPSDQQNQVLTQLADCLRGVISQRLLPRADGKGRVLATELMLVNDGIRACIRERRVHQIIGLMEIGKQDGMHLIEEHLVELLEQEIITPEDALAHARDAARLGGYV